MTPLLEVRSLAVHYGNRPDRLTAVRDVSFTLGSGRALGLVGESGSGKTSIAGAVLDLLGRGASVEGAIVFEGTDLRAVSARERRRLLGRRIGGVFQDPFTSFNPAIPVGRQIAEPLEQHLGLSRRAAFARACDLLADMHVDRPREIAGAWPHQLSGGLQQRALLAAAMACEPSLLVLDEPTTALDVTVEAQILALLRELRGRRAISLLFISHNIGVVREICDDISVLYASQFVEHGSADAVLERPRHPYTRGLLASLPPLEPGARTARLPSIGGHMVDLADPPPGCFFAPRCPFVEEACRAAVPELTRTGGGNAADRARRVRDLLDMVRLPYGYAGRYPHELSGGEKQRVAIARALATHPKFIVRDEPVSALDLSVQAAIVNLLADLRDEFGLAYLFISHDLAVVARLSDRIAVMYRGQIREIGATAELLATPSHPYTQALLSAARRETPRDATPTVEIAETACAFFGRCSARIDPLCRDVAPTLRPRTATHEIACHRFAGGAVA